MPRVKVDYVVSFSSEDSENEAKNLLAHDVSKKKWLCKEGETSCSVVLQFTKAVQISTVHIGACHAALVEVLVGRSEKPNDPFEVLVPSSVFLSPLDSRRGSGVERVRSFTGDQLGPARDGRWDRVRAVCSQPYNKHCKYGLSFVHIFEPEDRPDMASTAESSVAAALPGRMLVLDNFSSDEEDFRPGEMFAKHRISGQGASGDTGAQIRQATSQALKNISDSSTKLVKTPIAKANTNRPSQSNDCNINRQRDTLMYTDDDELPHTKIDKIVQRHKDDKEQESKKKEQKQERKKETPRKDKLENSSRTFKDFIDDTDKRKDLNDSRKDKGEITSRNKVDDSNRHGNRDDKRPGSSHDREEGNKRNDGSQDRDSRKRDDDRNKDKDSRKRPHFDAKQKDKELRLGPVSAAPHTLLAGAVFALSGYENPRRARLRDAAVALGARYERDWSPACTHLICAFPNTPKLKTVRASARNDACVAVLGEWVEQCCEKRRLLPWQWFATEPKKRVAPPDNYDDEKTASECDTDDEIEKVLRKQKKQRTDKSPPPSNRDRSPRPQTSKDRSPKPQTSKEKSPKPHTSRDRSPKPHTSRERSPKPHTSRERSPKPHTSSERSPKPHTSREKTSSKNNSLDFSIASTDSDVAFVKDERIQANITLDSDDETDEDKPSVKEKLDKKSLLPDFFEGYTFVIDERVEEAGFDKELLIRYVKAYGGVVMDPSLLDSDSVISFVLSTESGEQGGGKRVRPDWVWRCHEDKRMCEVAEYTL